MDAQQNLNFTGWTEMNLELILMSENDIAEFKKNVQCAFQKGFEDVFRSVYKGLHRVGI